MSPSCMYPLTGTYCTRASQASPGVLTELASLRTRGSYAGTALAPGPLMSFATARCVVPQASSCAFSVSAGDATSHMHRV